MKSDSLVFSKEFVYFLGLLWSDGYIDRGRTILEIVESDALEIVDDIKKLNFLKICTSTRQRKNRKPQMSIYFCNTKFYDNFQSKYFINKSICSPDQLLNVIPSNLIRYFYLGLIDGDGCFYFRKKSRQFYITSSHDQDWNHIVNLFKTININQYEIRKVESKLNHKSSYIRVKKHSEIVSIFNYLYPVGYEIGFKRKYNKCKEIIDNPPKYDSNKSKINKKDLLEKIGEGLNIYQISNIFECGWRKIHDYCKKEKIIKPKGFYTLI